MSTISVSIGMQALASLTYETAHAVGIKIRDFDYNSFESLVTNLFGANVMDNKITLVFQDEDNRKLLFLTYWDNEITIGQTIKILKDPRTRNQNYMVRKPNGKRKSGLQLLELEHPKFVSELMLMLSLHE